MPRSPSYDVIVVGAGIVGLAHALAAARRDARVLMIDRDAQANGASVRNFGFVTVTGQTRGRVWTLARRSAAIWREIAEPAGIAIEQEGLLLVAQRGEAADVLEAFAATEMGEDCTLLGADAAATRLPAALSSVIVSGLLSRADVRVESRTAIPRLAAWLQHTHGVTFVRGAAMSEVVSGGVICPDTSYVADAIIVCPGDDTATLFPDLFAAAGVTRCKLQMLRLANPGWRLPSPVMTDLSLIRYEGYAALPEANALRVRLEREEPAALAMGIHLIAAQSADGSLIVGDSHAYAATPDPFASSEVDIGILRQFVRLFGAAPPVIERWTGTYASVPNLHSMVRTPADGVRLVVVTSGTGASTAFALAEEVVGELLGEGERR